MRLFGLVIATVFLVGQAEAGFSRYQGICERPTNYNGLMKASDASAHTSSNGSSSDKKRTIPAWTQLYVGNPKSAYASSRGQSGRSNRRYGGGYLASGGGGGGFLGGDNGTNGGFDGDLVCFGTPDGPNGDPQPTDPGNPDPGPTPTSMPEPSGLMVWAICLASVAGIRQIRRKHSS